jgi:hypothetical protein
MWNGENGDIELVFIISSWLAESWKGLGRVLGVRVLNVFNVGCGEPSIGGGLGGGSCRTVTGIVETAGQP